MKGPDGRQTITCCASGCIQKAINLLRKWLHSEGNQFAAQIGYILQEEQDMKKCIVTVLGKDTVGIIAKVCTYLAENGINILDISQTIVQGYFNMMMIVDVTEKDTQFTKICDDLEKLGKEIGVNIRCQREEIFEKMHRL